MEVWVVNQSAPSKLSFVLVYNKYILLDVLVWSIAEYFYEMDRIYELCLEGESKHQQIVKILSDTTR